MLRKRFYDSITIIFIIVAILSMFLLQKIIISGFTKGQGLSGISSISLFLAYLPLLLTATIPLVTIVTDSSIAVAESSIDVTDSSIYMWYLCHVTSMT